MRAAARVGVYLLIALGCVPLLLIGLLAGAALLLYAVLEELADSSAGTAPITPIDEAHAREVARRVATGGETR